MHWIYLSPHLDDVALSCGGLVWEQARAGDLLQVWTVCAGHPPPGPVSSFAEQLHARWQTGPEAVAQRQAEDRASCRVMGATARHLSIPDGIYRSSPNTHAHLYISDEGLFNPLHPDEGALVEQLTRGLQASLPENAEVVCPLGLGNHVDHQLTRAATDRLGRALWYYADYPYALRETKRLEELRQAGWDAVEFPLSEEGFSAWTEAVAAHTSQVSTFWPDLEAMRLAMREYWASMGGVCLWKRLQQ